MLSQYNAVDIETILREENPSPAFPPAADRAAWKAIGEAAGEAVVADLLAQAEAAANSSISQASATLYLEFKRKGERRGYEALIQQRRAMLTVLALGECLEYQGRFLDPLLDVAWAICEESSWAYPAHQTELTDPDHPIIDLLASMTGTQLAELLMLLEPELEPALSKRIRYEVDRRLFTPYLTRHDHWWMYNTRDRDVNNWTAVCNGNVINAAVRLERDPARLAEMIARALRSLDDYMATFDPDGGSTEGPGYWGYGFGNFVLMAQSIEQRTNGKLPLLAGAHVRDIAQFPLRTILSGQSYVNFSDCHSHVSFPNALLVFLGERLELPGLLKIAAVQQGEAAQRREGELNWGLRNLVWALSPQQMSGEPFVPAKHDWYSGMHWMVARYNPQDPRALVLAAKGGHNGEMHNQNDIGNFIVHVNGESLVADLGSGRYTQAYFDERRYTHFTTQSFGHSCPVPNGEMQMPHVAPQRLPGNILKHDPNNKPGKFYAAQLLEHEANDDIDRMQLELKDVYPPEADLASLRRTIALHRESPRGWVEVVDAAEFASKPGMLESVLISFADVELDGDEVTLQGEQGKLAVRYEPGTVSVRVETVHDVDLAGGPRDVKRVIFALKSAQQQGRIRLSIVPDEV
ncbi:MAG: heparinase II/III family protein [Anaerolineae bacterium]|nr:heparinase II/III family protein [Anaerolineae bacterium]